MKKNRKYSLYLIDILESIEHIEDYTKGVTFIMLQKTFKLQDAVIRRLEVIGEAAKHIPIELKKMNPDISWREITGTRDVLIHEYFGVDLHEVWKIVKKDLPILKENIKELLLRNKGK